MSLHTETGLTAAVKYPNFLDDVYLIDREVYENSYWGEKENLIGRYNACKDSFVLLYDDDTLIGYINFFPVQNALHTKMLDPEDEIMYDDNITPEQITEWSELDPNNVFIISVAIVERFRSKEAVVALGNGLLEFLKEKDEKGFTVSSISGYAVSLGGVKFLKRFRGSVKKSTDNGSYYFYTDRNNFELVLKKGLNVYEKTYEDDLFFSIPMTLSIKNKNEAFEQFKQNPAQPSADGFSELYAEALNDHIEYECNSKCFKRGEMEKYYLGQFELACYDDDYDGIVLATERTHIFISAHEKTGICMVTMAIHDNHYNPSQLIDQMSTGHLEILDTEINQFVEITEYLENRFGFESCGEPKCVICMSDIPENTDELPYLLSGETMISSHIDYHIRPERMEELKKCRAVYDYYDSYISRSVIVFKFNKYPENFWDRVSQEASVLFVVAIVLFQNTAVLRTNRKVTAALTAENNVTNEEIDDLYIEFGKTMEFWDTDIFKYPFSQLEANEVISSFGIDKTLEDYHRNQQFLDRLIELKGTIEDQKLSKRMNYILYFLSLIQAVTLIPEAIIWVMRFLFNITMNDGGNDILKSSVTSVLFLALTIPFAIREIRGIIAKRKSKKARRLKK